MTIPQHSICLQPYIPNKTTYASQWKKDVRLLSETITKSVWSPIVFKTDKRREANFGYADWLVLDFDSGEMRLEDARNIFSDMFHLIAPSRSHSETHHKFRVCLLFEERIKNLQTFRFNMSRYIDQYQADNQCKDGARYYFPCLSVFSKANEPGLYKAEVLSLPPTFEQEIKIEKGEFSRFVRSMVGQTVPCGKRDVTTWAFARDLAKAGFSKAETKAFIKKWLNYEKPFNFEAKVETVFKQLRSECGKEKAGTAKSRTSSTGGSMDRDGQRSGTP